MTVERFSSLEGVDLNPNLPLDTKVLYMVVNCMEHIGSLSFGHYDITPRQLALEGVSDTLSIYRDNTALLLQQTVDKSDFIFMPEEKETAAIADVIPGVVTRVFEVLIHIR